MDEPFLLSNFIDLQEIDNEIYKIEAQKGESDNVILICLLYTSPSQRDS